MLEWTGERFLPWIEGAQIHYEHLHRYACAAQFVKGKKVIDLACGEGYGAALMAETAEHVIGIDLDEKTIEHASSRYIKDNLKFIKGSITDIPIKDKSKFDVITCFEAIEHIAEHDALLKEVKRLITDKGFFLVSTPNRKIYTDVPNYHNPYHVKELYLEEFENLLKKYFKNVRIWGQRVYAGSNIWSYGSHRSYYYHEFILKKGDRELEFTKRYDKKPVYWIALASDASLEESRYGGDSWLADLSDTLFNVYRNEAISRLQESNGKIDQLKLESQSKDEQLFELKIAYLSQNEQIIELESDVNNRNEQISALENTVRDRNEQISSLENTVRDRNEQISALEAVIHAKENQIIGIQAALNRINNGITVQLVSRIHKKIDILLPTGTRRRKYYELGLAGIRIIINEGWGNFFKKTINYLKNSTSHPQKVVSDLPKFDKTISKISVTKIILPIPSNRPEISIIIPAFNNIGYTLNCLKSISANTNGDFEVIVVDDCSTDKTKENLSAIKNLRYIKNKYNSGFLDSCNHGAQESKGKYLLFLNNDTIVTQNWLPPMLDLIKREDVGAVGSMLIYPDGKLQEAGSIIWKDGSAMGYGRGDDADKPEYNYVRTVDYCSGACLMVKKELFDKVGGFDDIFSPGYYEDADLCLALNKIGYKTIYQPNSVIIHFEGISHGTEINKGIKKYQQINQPKFVNKWADVLENHNRFSNYTNILIARDKRPTKRVLILDDRIPFPGQGSGYPRAYSLLKLTADLGYRVTFFPLDNATPWQPYTGEFQQLGVEIIYGPTILDFHAFAEKRQGYYDIVLVSRPHNMEKAIADINKFFPGSYIIYDAEALFSVRETLKAEIDGKKLRNGDFRQMLEQEIHLMSKANSIIVVSENEKSIIAGITGFDKKITVWGYPVKCQQKIVPFQQRQDLLFVGGFMALNSPNEDAVLYFIREIFPIVQKKLQCRLFIVGINPPEAVKKLSSSSIIVTGYVEDLKQYYDKCRVFIVPHRYSAGIPLKLIEAMSWGLPSVVSKLTASQLNLEDDREVLVGTTPEEYAQKIIDIYLDEVLWQKLSRNSLEYIYQNCNTEKLKSTLKNIFDSAL